ncbi:MAG: methyltransferase, partial [Chloroflexi bacterium]
DFGAQHSSFISPKAYRQLYQPFQKQVTEWIHKNTTWKAFIHSCGSVINLLPDFIASGFDILNPVQTSAAGMDPKELTTRFGDQIVFWGGGIDTQKVLPFGTPEEIRAQVRERMQTFGPGGGFVFNSIHNVQACTPVENMQALFEAIHEYRSYPL